MKFKDFLNLFKTEEYNKQHHLGVAYILSLNSSIDARNDPAVIKAKDIIKSYKDVSDVVCIKGELCSANRYADITGCLLKGIYNHILYNNSHTQNKIVNDIIMLQDVKGAIVIISDEIRTFGSVQEFDDIDDDEDRIKSIEELQEEISKKYSRARYDDDIIYKHYY